MGERTELYVLVPFRVIFPFKQVVSHFSFALNPENSIANLSYYVCKHFFIRVQLICNVVLVTGVEQSESIIHISPLFLILSPFRLLLNIE